MDGGLCAICRENLCEDLQVRVLCVFCVVLLFFFFGGLLCIEHLCSHMTCHHMQVLPCGHVMHSNCITLWLDQKANCPLCQHPCVVRLLTKLYYEPQKLIQAAYNKVKQQSDIDNDVTIGSDNKLLWGLGTRFQRDRNEKARGELERLQSEGVSLQRRISAVEEKIQSTQISSNALRDRALSARQNAQNARPELERLENESKSLQQRVGQMRKRRDCCAYIKELKRDLDRASGKNDVSVEQVSSFDQSGVTPPQLGHHGIYILQKAKAWMSQEFHAMNGELGKNKLAFDKKLAALSAEKGQLAYEAKQLRKKRAGDEQAIEDIDRSIKHARLKRNDENKPNKG